MTALSLRQIVTDELARIGLRPEPRPAGSHRTDFIAALPGFGIRSYASGKRVYIVQRRIGTRMRTITIGNAAVLSAATARDVARRILLRCDVGGDPAAVRVRVRSTPSFDDFVDEYWKRMAPRWRPSTLRTQDGYRRLHLDGAFPGKFVDQVDTADIASWFARLTDRSGPGAANRCFAILKAMLRKAEDWGYRPEGSNPCRGVRVHRSRPCERFLVEEELARLGAALKRAEVAAPLQASALALLLLTGCRKSEILDLRWSAVKGRRLLLTDSKTGPRAVWLGEEARAVLGRLRRGRPTDRVFDLEAQSRNALEHTWRTVRADAGLSGVRLHDLRHSFASFAARNAETLPMIGKLLGHAKLSSTARYAHLDDETVCEAAEQIGDLILSAMGARPSAISIGLGNAR